MRTGDFVVQLWYAEQSVELEAENWRLCGTTLGAGRLSSTTLVRGENWRLCSTTLVRGVSVELETANWRLCSTTLVRGAIWGAGS